MKLTKQTVYIECNKGYDFIAETSGGCLKIKENEGYFFTSKELNEYTEHIIRQTLEVVINKALLKTEYISEVYDSNFADTALPNEEIFLIKDSDGMPYAAIRVTINKQSILDTFEQTFNKLKV
jgi:hypothetical protein